MKILLVQPPLIPTVIGAGSAYLTEPLALEVIAAAVPSHEVRILDLRLDPDLDGMLERFQPEVVGVTGNTTDVYRMLALLQRVKDFNGSIHTVAGGHHATMVPQDFFRPQVDVIVRGEGETTFAELVAAWERGRDVAAIDGIACRGASGAFFLAPARAPQTDLDRMPLPDRRLTQEHRDRYFRGNWRPVTSLMTSRGCPFRCSFCALWKAADGKYCMRSPRSVVDELEQIPERYIDFAEDNALHHIPRAEALARLIAERNIKKTYKLYARTDTIVRHPSIIEQWKAVGMELILVGLESFRDGELAYLNKNNSVSNNEKAVRILQDNGVEIAAYFIVHPDYSEEDFRRLGEYVAGLGLTQPVFTVLTPLPGTELYAQKYRELTTHNYEFYDFLHPVLPTRLPLPRFFECLLELYRACYSAGGNRSSFVTSDHIFQQVRSLLSATLPALGQEKTFPA